MVEVHPLGALMRRFVVDWLDRADPAVPPEILTPEYTIVIAGVTMTGRDNYLEATTGQLARFPGLTVTVHDAIYTTGSERTDHVALRFTEHGSSARGGAAAWRGIGLFRVEDGVLVHNATEEDYLGRRRQLLAGRPDPVDPPMVAPWTEPPAPPHPEAEQAVRTWLGTGGPGGTEPGIAFDDDAPGRGGMLLDEPRCEVEVLFAAGRRVAFHATQYGTYAGGCDAATAEPGAPVTMACAGLVDVADDGTLTGYVVRDRLALRRSGG